MLSNFWISLALGLIGHSTAPIGAVTHSPESFVGRAGFTVIRDHGIAWLVGPDGNREWSLGVCVVDPGVKFDDYDVTNPAYAAWRFYPSKSAWAEDAVRLLQSGGFNTIGAWSDYAALLKAPSNHLMMTPILHSGSSAGFPWLDMWDPKLVQVADDVTKGLIQSLKNDPRIIGYFSDNELGWWKPAVLDWVWKQKTPFTRHHAVATLQRHYRGSWGAFTTEFNVVGANSWTQLQVKGQPFLRPDAKGQAALSELLAMLADRYYRLCRDLIKKYAPNALYLGDRYISNYYPEVAKAAGKYCDVVSTNLNPDFTDGSFVHFYLNGLEALTHKPLMITEFYMTSRQGRSGNGNNSSGFPVVDTLAERADGFAATTTALLHNPNVVGAHWFQYYDEPQNGRGDGENYNFGLVDTSNHPYQELLAKSSAMNLIEQHEHAARESFENGAVPSEPSPSLDLTTWKRSEGYVLPDQQIARADLYLEWNSKNLELGLVWPEERFGEGYFKDGKIPASCLTTLEITIGGKTYLVRIDPNSKEFSPIQNWKAALNLGTTSRLVLAIPSSNFGVDGFSAGQSVEFSARLVSECRAYTTTWTVKRNLGQ